MPSVEIVSHCFFQDWDTNTQPLDDDEVQDALDRFDARAAAE